MGNLDVIAAQTSGKDTVYSSSGADKFILSAADGCVIINGQAGYKKPHKEALWSPSYFAISVGTAPIEVLKEYIKNQSRLGSGGREHPINPGQRLSV